jgi:two-component system sensor histidine kinase VicK
MVLLKNNIMNQLDNQLFCQMGEISNDGYYIFHTNEKKFSYLNQALANLWEIDFDVLKADPSKLMEGIHPEDREHARLCYLECFEDFLPKKYELRLLPKEAEKYVRFSIYPFLSNDQIILCGTVEDITVAKHNKNHIELINAHKNITLEVLSHDLKEPLGMMRLTASALEKEVEATGNKKMLDSILFIKEMCERNIKLVRSMVNREFVKSSVVELKKERADLVWEIQDVVRFYRRSHLRELKDFRFDSSHEKIYLFLDSMKFLQVINNLISNAIKFTSVGGVIDVQIQNKKASVIVSVADNGIGIPDELKPHLFDRGNAGLKPGLDGKESGGLGMSIIRSIVELHGGKVWFESEVGRGSTFYIELPKE